MAQETSITIVGRLTEDPELRHTQNGVPVASFTVASNSRQFDRQNNEWTDKPAAFWKCNAWRSLADNSVQSLRKGMEVIVQGNVENRPYQDRDGNNRSSLEVDVQAVGPNLRNQTAQVQKVQSNGTQDANREQYRQQQNQGQPQPQQPPQGQYQQQPQQQPVQNSGQQQPDNWLPNQGGSQYNDETPF